MVVRRAPWIRVPPRQTRRSWCQASQSTAAAADVAAATTGRSSAQSRADRRLTINPDPTAATMPSAAAMYQRHAWNAQTILVIQAARIKPPERSPSGPPRIEAPAREAIKLRRQPTLPRSIATTAKQTLIANTVTHVRSKPTSSRATAATTNACATLVCHTSDGRLYARQTPSHVCCVRRHWGPDRYEYYSMRRRSIRPYSCLIAVARRLAMRVPKCTASRRPCRSFSLDR